MLFLRQYYLFQKTLKEGESFDLKVQIRDYLANAASSQRLVKLILMLILFLKCERT